MVHECGIRLGEAVQQDMIAMRLTRPFKAILVASKAYVDAKGAPKTIGDLRDHNCIGFRMVGSGGVYAWELSDGGKVVAVKTSGTTLVTDATHARDLALAGVGIAYIFEPLVRRHIREGRLKWLLPRSAVDQDGLFLYYPQRASLAPKLRAFICGKGNIRALTKPRTRTGVRARQCRVHVGIASPGDVVICQSSTRVSDIDDPGRSSQRRGVAGPCISIPSSCRVSSSRGWWDGTSCSRHSRSVLRPSLPSLKARMR
jgi:hypothetical protein